MSDTKAAQESTRTGGSRFRLKWLFIAVAGILFIGAVVAAVIYVPRYFSADTPEVKKAKEDIGAMNFTVDTGNAAIAYTEKLNAKDDQAAIDVYKEAFKGAASNDAKREVAHGVWLVARERSKYSHMVTTAKDLVSVDPSLENYDILVLSHAANGEYDGAVDASEKMIARFDELHSTGLTEDQKAERQQYIERLEGMKLRHAVLQSQSSEGGQ